MSNKNTYKPQKKSIELKDIINMIKELAENKEETITLKTSAMLDLIKKIEDSEIYIQILSVQKINLVEKLISLGIEEKDIKELLNVK